MAKKKKTLELSESWAVFCIPTDTIELRLTAKIMRNGKLQEVSKDLTMHEVRQAIAEGEEYISPYATFKITEEGKKFLDDLEREQNELCKQ